MAKYKWRATPQALRNIAILLALILIIIFMIANGITKAIKNGVAKRQYKVLTKQIQVVVDDYADNGLSYPSGEMNAAVTTKLPSSVTEYLWVYEHKAELPAGTVETAQKNLSFAHFLYRYGNGATSPSSPKLTDAELQGGVPTLYQWDERWGFTPFGDSTIGVCGGGPTAVSMILIGITGDASATPTAVAEYAEDQGLYFSGYGSMWGLVPWAADDFFSEASGHRIYYEEVILDENALKDALDEGKIVSIVTSKGTFTKEESGFIVLVDYNSEGFIIRDPLSEANTNKVWKFKEFEDEIVAIWALWE